MLLCCPDDKLDLFKSAIPIIWIVINFIEQVILVTYIYHLSINPIKLAVKFELIGTFIVWITYPSFLRIINLFYSNDHYCIISLACVVFLWVCLVFNGYVPLVYNYLYNTSNITYPLDSNLTDNLFLFLSDEKCVESFDQYIQSTDNQKTSVSLNFYVDCMSYRLLINLNYRKEDILKQVKHIILTYFDTKDMKLFDANITHKVLESCKTLKNTEYSKDVFDEAIEIAFENLEETFSEYKRTKEYKYLLERLNKESEFQCKMAIAGLVKNK